MAIKYGKPDSSSSVIKNVKTVVFGDQRVGKVVYVNDRGEVKVPYLLKYPISATIENGSFIQEGGTIPSLNFGQDGLFYIRPLSGFNYPANSSAISVTGAVIKEYEANTGALTLSRSTAKWVKEITVAAACSPQRFSITVDMNSTGSYTGDSFVDYGGGATVTIKPGNGKILPSSVTVTGASYSYDQSTGKITLSDAISNVDISVVCPSGYKITTTISGGSASPSSTTVVEGGNTTINLTAIEGYGLPEKITVNGTQGNSGSEYPANWTYSRTSTTSGEIIISNVIGTVTITVTCGQLPQLGAPSIGVFNGKLKITTSDQNTQQYDIYVGGVKVRTIPKYH